MKWISGNQVEILSTGEAFFQRLIFEIERAKSEIIFETYIFENDSVGQKIANALKSAGNRGIQISLVVDGVGSVNTPKAFFESLQRVGIQTATFQIFRQFPLLQGFQVRRLHRKVIVIDERIAFVGGINIAEDQIDTASPGKLDLAVFVEGPVVRRIHSSSKRFFLRLTRQFMEWFRFEKRRFKTSPIALKGRIPALYLIRDNFGHRRKLERTYLGAIDAAQTEILIASAYFVPHLRLQLKLKAAARRGVKVAVLIQGKSDAPVAYHAARPLYRSLIKAGVELVECDKRILHAKAAVIDQQWSTVGSFNWEPLSVFLNIEGNLFMNDSATASQIRQVLTTWRSIYGRRVELKDLEMSLIQFIQTILSRAVYWLASLIGRTRFD